MNVTTTATAPTPSTFPLPPELGGGAIRVITVEGEPWFIAADIGTALDLTNIRMNVATLDEEEAGVSILYTSSQRREMSIVSESGLYALVLKSTKPSAKAFRKWVTGTVLPTIRKTGSYIVGEEAIDVTTDAGFAAIMALALKAADAKIAAAKAERDAANAKAIIAEAKYEVARPKAEAFEVIETAAGSLTITNAANALGVKPRVELMPWLKDNGWLTKKGMPTAIALTHGVMDTIAYTDALGVLRQNARVTPKGLAKLAEVKARRGLKAA